MHSSHVLHPVTWETFFNFSVLLLVLGVSIYYFIKGRKADRLLMGFNVFLAFLAVILFCVFFVDHYYYDLLDYLEVSMFVIKPLYTICLAAWLSNLVRIGKNRVY